MVDISYSRFAPDYSRAEYSELDALSFCLASRLAYAKNPSGGIARERISDQIKAWTSRMSSSSKSCVDAISIPKGSLQATRCLADRT